METAIDRPIELAMDSIRKMKRSNLASLMGELDRTYRIDEMTIMFICKSNIRQIIERFTLQSKIARLSELMLTQPGTSRNRFVKYIYYK